MKKKIGIIFILSIIAYGLWNGRNLILGPKIEIKFPKDGQSFESDLITISGKAKNVAFIHLNGRQIFIEENGNFVEDLVLQTGYNIIELRGRDKFGKELVKRLQLYNVEIAPTSTTNNNVQ